MSEDTALRWKTACYLTVGKEDMAGVEGVRGRAGQVKEDRDKPV